MKRVKWLKNKVQILNCRPRACIYQSLQGYEYREAVDGLEGVRTFETDGRFEYVDATRLILPPNHSVY